MMSSPIQEVCSAEDHPCSAAASSTTWSPAPPPPSGDKQTTVSARKKRKGTILAEVDCRVFSTGLFFQLLESMANSQTFCSRSKSSICASIVNTNPCSRAKILRKKSGRCTNSASRVSAVQLGGGALAAAAVQLVGGAGGWGRSVFTSREEDEDRAEGSCVARLRVLRCPGGLENVAGYLLLLAVVALARNGIVVARPPGATAPAESKLAPTGVVVMVGVAATGVEVVVQTCRGEIVSCPTPGKMVKDGPGFFNTGRGKKPQSVWSSTRTKSSFSTHNSTILDRIINCSTLVSSSRLCKGKNRGVS